MSTENTSKSSAKSGSAEEINALARGLGVLRRVAQANTPISNRELAEETGIPKATVSRITATLVNTGFLWQLPDSERFILTASVLELSNGFLRNFDIRARARPYLTALANRVELAVHLTVRDRLDMVVIEAAKPRAAIMVSRLEPGGRFDMATTSAGRAYLAALPEREREEIIAGMRIAGGNLAALFKRLDDAIADTLRRGYAIALGEWNPQINAIGTAVIGPTGECYAINCGGSAFEASDATLREQAAPRLIECAEQIAAEIGGQPLHKLPTR
jgi:IclR family transcriptional regulator, positive regulator for flagellar biogenesis